MYLTTSSAKCVFTVVPKKSYHSRRFIAQVQHAKVPERETCTDNKKQNHPCCRLGTRLQEKKVDVTIE